MTLHANRGTRHTAGAHGPNRLADGACPACGKPAAISPRGNRRRHFDRHHRPCLAGGVHVLPPPRGDAAPFEHPGITFPPDPSATGRPRTRTPAPTCDCGQRPRTRKDGSTARHRTDVDDPSSPYCPAGEPETTP